MQKYSQMQCNPMLLKTLDLGKSIISGISELQSIELDLKISDTLQYPNVRSVFKNENGQIGYSVINILVKRFSESFGFSTKMNDSQIEMLTIDTLEHFAYESLHDVILFFKMARTGKFGATNRGVDSNLIFGDWFIKYLELKAIEREIKNQKEKQEIIKETLSIEDIRKAYKKINPQLQHDKILKRIDEITEGFTRDQLENLISEWNKDENKKPYLELLKRKRLIIK